MSSGSLLKWSEAHLLQMSCSEAFPASHAKVDRLSLSIPYCDLKLAGHVRTVQP